MYQPTWIVTCARCGQDWPEDAEGVTWRDGDYWCRYQEDCDQWISQIEEQADGR